MVFDSVICVAPQHKTIAVMACRSLHLHSQTRNMYVVTAPENFVAFQKLKDEGTAIILLDENECVEGLSLKTIQDYMKQRNVSIERAGWYLQQFLKMGMCFWPQISDNYLIWDADTLLLQPLPFFDSNGGTLITPRRGYHKPYFDLTRRLLGFERSVNFCFISQHVMAKKTYMQEMIEEITAQFPDKKSWVCAILDLIEDRELSRSGFSEYETYGNFVHLRHAESYACRPIRYSRKGTQIFGPRPNKSDLYLASKRYAIETFESRYAPYRLSFLYKAFARCIYERDQFLNRLAGSSDDRFRPAEEICR